MRASTAVREALEDLGYPQPLWNRSASFDFLVQQHGSPRAESASLHIRPQAAEEYLVPEVRALTSYVPK